MTGTTIHPTATANKVIRVLIVDDHGLFRGGVLRMLEPERDMQAQACGSVAEAVEILTRQPMDVILLDYDLGTEHGSELVAIMKERGLRGRILVVTAGVSGRQAMDLMQQGVAGIFPKTDSPQALVEAIRKVHSGEAWLKQDHLQLLVQNLNEPAQPGEKALSARERAVLRGVVEGLANKEIAAELQISESSVKAALQQVFNKTGVRTRSQLVRVALDRYRDLVV
jgi:two-component system, NarL family, nitrate/nitrite response regulator NarL